MDLRGKTALITGSAKRLGREIALELARCGASVVIHYLSSEAEAISLEDSVKKMGVQAKAIRADLADSDQCLELISKAVVLTGSLDYLINNASIFDPTPFASTDLDLWQKHLAINLTAPFLLSKAFSKLHDSDSRAAILNMLDWRAQRPTSSAFAYTISKAGLATMTKSLAQALAPGTRVNALALGPVLPAAWEGEQYPKELIEKIPAGRQGTIQEVIDSTMFLLAGPEFITGEILHLDGGRNLV